MRNHGGNEIMIRFQPYIIMQQSMNLNNRMQDKSQCVVGPMVRIEKLGCQNKSEDSCQYMTQQ
jgi:hypothetical protein